MVKLVDTIAPEHLELSVAKPRELMSRIKMQALFFLEDFVPSFLVIIVLAPTMLPTSGAARFASPLSL